LDELLEEIKQHGPGDMRGVEILKEDELVIGLGVSQSADARV
jgi:hypothetical protein